MSKHIPWTPEEDARVVQLRQQGFQVRDVAEHLGRSTNSVSYRLRILKEQGQLPITDKQGKVVRELPTAKTSVDNFQDAVSEAAYEFENEALQAELKDLKQQIDQYENHTVTPLWDDDWDGPGEWSRAEKKSAKRIDKEIKRGKFNVSFPNGPIAISVISDQHIAPGSACDFKRMREDAILIRDTPGFYAVFGGDGVDNHIKHRSALIGANSTPDEQWKLFDYYLQLFGDKILAVISGNHDAWTAQIGGVDYLSKIVAQHKICYAPAEARLYIDVGGQEYKMVVRHQTGRFNSSLNQTHAVKRFYEYGEEPFDIGVIGHHHEAATEMFIRHGLKRYAARPGSYQITSPYSHQYGFASAIPTCPTFVLFPEERRMIGFSDVRDAVWAWKDRIN
tara:strand:+ start:1080 stop:2255 length:1176 start_codon:yes stop_codon:yes gene_type:complete